jgi:hypothetical protein
MGAVPTMSALLSDDASDARRRCETACRDLASACLDLTSADVKRRVAAELVGRAIDCAYVAGTAARLTTRIEMLDDDTVVLQLLVAERAALAFAITCDDAVGPGVAICADRARECASSCAEMRDLLTGFSDAPTAVIGSYSGYDSGVVEDSARGDTGSARVIGAGSAGTKAAAAASK